jgi:putative Mn2+ efflux pump MntP
MDIISIFLLGICLSIDAISATIVASISSKNTFKITLKCAITFGIFQGIMPLMGYILQSSINSYITSIDHYIAFFLLSIIGINMIRDRNSQVEFKNIFLLGIATSIDAFAVGASLETMNLSIVLSCILIPLTTFCLCFIFGLLARLVSDLGSTSKVVGGIILIIIGIHTLIEHLVN